MAERSNPADGIGATDSLADPAGHGPSVSESARTPEVSVTRDGLTIDRLFTTPAFIPMTALNGNDATSFRPTGRPARPFSSSVASNSQPIGR